MEMHRALSNSLSIKTNVEVITGNKNNLWKSSVMSENVTFSAVVAKKSLRLYHQVPYLTHKSI